MKKLPGWALWTLVWVCNGLVAVLELLGEEASQEIQARKDKKETP